MLPTKIFRVQIKFGEFNFSEFLALFNLNHDNVLNFEFFAAPLI
jgi:hypothetical protein